MECKKQVQILYVIIWILIIWLWVSLYTRYTSTQNWFYGPWDWTMRRFWSWSRMWRWMMWSWMINNFSPEQKAIIDELKKARDSWDKDKERELMDKLRNNMNNWNKK